MKILTLRVENGDGEVRLDRWIKRQNAQFTQGIIQKLCRTGQIRVNGKRVQASVHLFPENIVRFPEIMNDPSSSLAHKTRVIPNILQNEIAQWILYEDEDVFVLNKPSGIAVQGGSNILHHVDGALEVLQGRSKFRPTLVHRLDKDTSGILLIAKHPAAASKLAASFRGRNVKKTYWAVTIRRPSPLSGRIVLPLVKKESQYGSFMQPTSQKDKDGLYAETEYQVKEFAARKFAWVELYPLTGRMHQLRVHCAEMNTPILGDKKYCKDVTVIDGFPDKLHLHARMIEIPHPSGGRLIAEAPLPRHMKDTFRCLGFTCPELKKAYRVNR